MQAFLSGLDIDISDARIVFTLLDVATLIQGFQVCEALLFLWFVAT